MDFARNNRHEVLIPTHSEDTYLISRHKAELEPYVKVPLHDYASIIKAHDKASAAQLAQELSIPIPRTYMARDVDELHRQAEVMSFPLVIKIRTGTSSRGISFVRSRDELFARYSETVSRFNLAPEDHPLVQEYIPGGGYGVSLLFNRGELRAKFTHQRIREYPPSGGPSTCRVSVSHPEMEEMAIRLLKHLNWHGVAMVEFKLDQRTGKPVLLEVNPRFWGSLNQAICSGVDFPYLLYRMALEGDVAPVLTYKLGVRTRVAFIDYVTLLYQLRHSPARWQTAKEFFRFAADDILSLTDPLPALGFICNQVRGKNSR